MSVHAQDGLEIIIGFLALFLNLTAQLVILILCGAGSGGGICLDVCDMSCLITLQWRWCLHVCKKTTKYVGVSLCIIIQ